MAGGGEEFSFQHTEFQMPKKHPSVWWEIGRWSSVYIALGVTCFLVKPQMWKKSHRKRGHQRYISWEPQYLKDIQSKRNKENWQRMAGTAGEKEICVHHASSHESASSTLLLLETSGPSFHFQFFPEFYWWCLQTVRQTCVPLTKLLVASGSRFKPSSAPTGLCDHFPTGP